MRTTVQSDWLKKAGATAACSVFMGSSPAQCFTGNMPVAVSLPVGRTMMPVHTGGGSSGHGWSSPGGGKAGWNNSSNSKSSNNSSGSSSSGSGSGKSSGNQHGQPFWNNLPGYGSKHGWSLFGNSNWPAQGGGQGGQSGPGLQLDLTSTNGNIVLGSSTMMGKQSVTIVVGGTNEVFSAGSRVTAAEYVAINQVLSGAGQTLELSSQGAATGGTFTISAVTSAHISELVVPTGVTCLDYATHGQNQVISGDVFNYGTIYGITGNGQGNQINISAQEIVNESGGLISTKAPSTMISAVGGVLMPLNLSLTGTNELLNEGSIVSSGSLSLTCTTGSISNGVLPSSTNGGQSSAASSATIAPTITAVHDITLSSGNGNFTNVGTIASTGGNINFTTPDNKNAINISAPGGTFQAATGDINVRTSSYNGSAGINMAGGDYLSNNLNLYSGTGTIEGNVGQITGTLNTTAGGAHVVASTATLDLGKNLDSGDPTFVNSDGDITISGTNQFSEDVAIIASGNIFGDSAGQIIDNGHNVTLVAGANIVSSNPGDNNGTVSGNGGGSVSGNATAPVTIDTSTSSASGGNIDFTASTVQTVINTSSTTGNAGNVTLVAFGSAPLGGGSTVQVQGQVLFPNGSIINATGGGSGSGGNVTVIGGNNTANFFNTIQVGTIYTGGGSAGGQGGNISLTTAAPTTSNAATSTLITYGTNGSVTTGNTFVPSATINPYANIQAFGDLVTAPFGQSGVTAGSSGASGGNISITAGGNVLTQNLLAFGGGGAGGDSVNTNGGAGGNGGNISVSSSEQFSIIQIQGQVNASGGGGGGAGSNGSTFGTGGAGGSGGSISIVQTGGGSQGEPLISTTGGVTAAQGGAGGNASATAVGGGGGSWGGGGGGGSSGTGGTPGNTGTVGSIGGGAGGAGFYGGGGGDLDGAGGGGGYTGGSAGGSAVNATAGMLSAGGNGAVTSGSTPLGGVLGTSQQGGQGVGSGANGGNIPTATGGGNVTLSAAGTATLNGPIAGSNVTINEQSNLTFSGNVVGTSSVTINDPAGSITMASSGLSISTQALTLNVVPTFTNGVNIGSAFAPITTNAQSITINGDSQGTFISDSGASLTFNGSGMGQASNLNITMTANNAMLNVAGLPASLSTLNLNTGSSATTGGTINFAPSSVQVGPGGSITLTSNNLSWSNAGSSDLAISANNSAGSGGSISITTNQVNGTNNIAIGSGAGALNLSATASMGAVGIAGGSVTLVAPSANLTVAGTGINVGYSDASTAGNGGTIVLNVGTLAGAGGNAAVLNASAAAAGNGGTGNGGTITVTTNTANNQTIGSSSGDVELIATNGGTAGTSTQSSGSVSFTNLGSGTLTVGPAGISVTNNSGGTANVTGGSITFSANTVTSASGTVAINVDGQGSGNGGKISITETNTNNPAAVTLGPGGQFVLSAQGGTTGGNGGSITFSTQGALLFNTDANGNVIGSGLSAAVEPQSASGGGGTLTLTAASFANANATLGSTTPLIFNASGVGSGNGGRIRLTQLDPNSNMTVGSAPGDLEFNAANGVNGTTSGTVILTINNNSTFTGTGTLNVDPSGIVVTNSSGGGTVINGGFIELVAPTIAAASTVPAGSPLILNVSGVGTGKGGTIIFEESNANSNPTIGTAAGQFELLAAGGTTGGSGGSIIATSGGNLTVNPAGLSVAAAGNGNGGDLSLSALNFGNVMDGSQGNLLITGNLSVVPAGTGAGGTIGLLSNSANAFNIGSTTNNLNGIEGTLTLTNGNLDISQSGTGDISINSAITSPQFITITFGTNATGNLDINAQVGGSGTSEIFIAPSGTGTAAVANIIGGTGGSLVTSATGSMILTAQNSISGLTTVTNGVSTTAQLQINTGSLEANTTTGDIDINDAISLTSTLTIQQLNAGGSFNISSGGNITTANFTGGVDGSNSPGFSSGTVATANVSGSITAAGSINGQWSAPSLNVDSPRYKEVNKFIFQCVQATYTFGSVVNGSISAPQTNSPNLLVRNDALVAPSSQNEIFVTYGADGVGGCSFQSDTSISMSGTFGNSSTTSIAVLTGAGATISGSAVLTAKSVQLTTIGADIGSAGSALQVSTPSLTLDTGGTGNVYVSNVAKAAFAVTMETPSTSLTLSTVGAANYSNLSTTGGDINLTSGGATTVSNVNSAGNLNITETAGALTLSSSTAALNASVNSTAGGTISGLTSTQGTISIQTAGKTSVGTSQSFGTFTVDETKGDLTVTTASSQNGVVQISGANVTVNGLTNTSDVDITSTGPTSATNVTSTNGQVIVNSTGAATLSGLSANTNIVVTDSAATTASMLTTNNGSITLSSGGKATLSAFFSTNGDIDITTGAASTINNVVSSGNLNVTETAGALTLSASTAASNISVNSTAGGTISGLTATQGTINIQTAGATSVGTSQSSGTFTVDETKGDLTVTTASSLNAAVQISGVNVTVNGLTNASDVDITSTGPTSATNVTSTNGQIIVSSTGAATLTGLAANTNIVVTDSGATTASTFTTNDGSITLSSKGAASLSGLTATNGAITITDGNTTTVSGTGLAAMTAGVGTISITSSGASTLSSIGAASGVTITGTGGITATGISTETGNLTITANGTGAVSLSSISTTTSGNISITSGGKTTTLSGIDSAGSITVTAANATTLGNMTALGQTGDGFISVISTTGALQTSAGAQIFSQNDSILLENKSVSAGTIVIAAGTEIETGLEPNPGGNGGNIAITIGAPPTPAASPAQQGLAPSSTLVTATTDNGVIYWGKNGITAELSGGVGNIVTAQAANVIFNTGTAKATAITLDGDTTIIADPPVTGGSSAPASTSAVAAFTASSAPATSQAPSQVPGRPEISVGSSDFSATANMQLANADLAGITPAFTGHTDLGDNVATLASATEQLFSSVAPLNSSVSIGALTAQQATPGHNPTPASQNEGAWASETEIESGLIPAVISSDHDLGIKPVVSSVLEMSETGEAPTGNAALQTTATSAIQNYAHTEKQDTTAKQRVASTQLPLSGAVSYFSKAAVKQVNLGRGSVVFTPTKPTVVETPFGKISLAAKSIVLVMVMNNRLAIYDFDDTHKGAVKLTAGGKDFILTPGRHALISKTKNKEFEHLNAAQLFAYRDIRKEAIAIGGSQSTPTMQAFTADFNLQQAISTVLPLRQLIGSKNAEAKRISQRLLKTTGIMSELTAGGEQFRQVLRPDLVAMGNSRN